MVEAPSILLDGRRYAGWSDLRITRGMERLAADFEMAAPVRWHGPEGATPITLFAPCQVLLGDDEVLTGYVDQLSGKLAKRDRMQRVGGRSRTADLVDCSAILEGGEFRDSTFAAICRAVTEPFGIEVNDAAGVGGQVISLEAMDQTETCFSFLERVARVANVVLTDDPRGRLVVARSSGARASGTLREGLNVLAAETRLDASRRYDRYIVNAQLPGAASWQGIYDINGNEALTPGARPRPNIRAVYTDPDVPRYRPLSIQAEGNVEEPGALARALWQSRRDIARGTELQVTVPGWRQEDGRLWTINELIPVVLPSLGVEADLLISTVSFVLNVNDGAITALTLCPPDAFTPEPAGDLTRSRSAGRFEGIRPISSGDS